MGLIKKKVICLTLVSLILACFQTVVAQSANAADVTVNYLLVGAGGNGGNANGGGGGGAGGVKSGSTSIPRDLTSYSINIGAAGTSKNSAFNSDGSPDGLGSPWVNQGNDGQPTIFSGGTLESVTAFGGGGGGANGYSPGRNGASGGGSGYTSGSCALGTTPFAGGVALVFGGATQGSNGGSGYQGANDCNRYHGGGGGGSSGAGLAGKDSGAGGAGTDQFSPLLILVSNSGTEVGVLSSSKRYIAGGGAGAGAEAWGTTAGGIGGGGSGGGGLIGTAGLANTGSGGGFSASGGSGLGILYYTSAVQLFGGGTVTSSGTGNSKVWYHVFKTTGENSFSYIGPILSSLSTTSGLDDGGTVTTISGSNLSGTSEITVGGAAATLGTITSTSATFTTPAGTVGAKDVVLTTANGDATLAAAFTFTSSVPTLSGVSVAYGADAGGTTTTISGTLLNKGTPTVTVGGETATVSSFTSTSIQIVTPAGTVGAKDIVVTTSRGSATLTAAFTYFLTYKAYVWSELTGSGKNDWAGVSGSDDGVKLAAISGGISQPGYIYTSTDSGLTWTKRTVAGNKNWTGITSSDDGTKLAASQWGGNIFTSTDSGITWTEQLGTPQLTVGQKKRWIYITGSANGADLAALAWGGTIYKSSDSGATWTAGACGSTNWASFTSSRDMTHFLIWDFYGSVYKSSDSLATCPQLFNDGGGLNPVWESFALGTDGNKLFGVNRNGNAAALSSQMFISNNFGSTGTRTDISASLDRNNPSWITSNPAGTHLVRGAYGLGIYTSTDSGATFKEETPPPKGISAYVNSSGEKIIAMATRYNLWSGLLSNLALPVIISNTISGSPLVWQTLTATTVTTGLPAPTVTYQWKRDGVAISGATTASYMLTLSDLGKNITVTATSTNSVGAATNTTSNFGPINIQYTLSYGNGSGANAGVGTPPAAQIFTTNGTGLVVASSTTMTKSGYFLAGWVDSTANAYTLGQTDVALTANKTLTPTWTHGTFTVTFNKNNVSATGTTAAQSAAATTPLSVNGFSYANHNFLEWNTSADGTGTGYLDSASYAFLANVTLYAQWGNVITYSNIGATSGAPSRSSDQWISGVVALPTAGTMLKTGYTFAGWSDASTVYTTTYTPTGGITLNPSWTANTYVMSYNKNGAISGTVPVNSNWTVATSALSLPGNSGTLVKTGYTFAGWSLTPGGSVITSHTPTTHTTFYASWTINQYPILYAINGGSSSLPVNTNTYTIGQNFTVAAAASKTGAIFGGWSDGTLLYGAGSTYFVNGLIANITLTAQWIPTYTVHYVMNGSGSTPEADATLASGTSIIVATEPTRTGYTFSGWLDNATPQVLHAAGSAFSVVQDSNLTAQWTPISYSVTYALASGTSTLPTQTAKNIGNTFTIASEPTRPGYLFTGWSDGTNTYGATALYAVGSQNITLTATWSAISYSVTYDLGAGLGAIPTQTDKTITQTFSLPTSASNPTKRAHTFFGWSDGNSTFQPSDTYTVGLANVVLTAIWTINGYTQVSFSAGAGSGLVPVVMSGLEGSYISLPVPSGLTKNGSVFRGWSDSMNTYQPLESFYVGPVSIPITLTALWDQTYSVTYLAGTSTGNVPVDGNGYVQGGTATVLTVGSLVKSGYSFAGWSDGVNTIAAGSTLTVGSANITLTAQWTLIPIVVVPVVVPVPVAPTGPPPSILKTISNPKISRDDKSFYCEIGKYIFLREGRTEEVPKLTTQVFYLLQNGKVIESISSALDKVFFKNSETYIETTMTCQVDVGQESQISTSFSMNSTELASIAQIKRNALDAAEAKYYKDRTDAYAKKDLEFARLLEVKTASISINKSAKEILAASAKYQSAYQAASNLWKKELADASSNRVLAKELAHREYLAALESAGISIYPVLAKAAVTPTPTVTPKPEATPTTSPASTNVQPTPEMKKVGTVYMASGSYFLNDATKASLKALAKKVNTAAIKQVLVYGHTDNRAGVNNTVLSQQRAKAVANYLRPLLPGKKIVIGWYASRKPLATGSSKADLAKNRRVEIYQR